VLHVVPGFEEEVAENSQGLLGRDSQHCGCLQIINQPDRKNLGTKTERPPCHKQRRPILLVDDLRTIDVLGLEALWTSLDLELHLRTLLERPVSIHLDSREVHEYIIAVRALDETIALCGVKPFNYTFFSHY
jgi:hypothetical protein